MQRFEQFIHNAKKTNEYLEVRSPYNEELIAEVEKTSAEGMEQAMKNATTTWKQTMKNMPAYERANILYKVADMMKQDHDDLSMTIAQEGGKPLKDAQVEVTRAINTVKMSGDEALNLDGEILQMDKSPAGLNHIAMTIRESIGPVLAISAFNHPVNLICHQMATAFAAGNSVIVKPASTTPISAFKLALLFEKAGVPDGVINITIVSGSKTTTMVKDPRIKFVTFIGGEDVGWNLRKLIAPGTNLSLEHGGTGTSIVTKNADLDMAVPKIVKGGFYHAGQVCVSTQNTYIHQEIYDETIERILADVKKLKIGDPTELSTDVGPIINEEETKRFEGWVKEAVSDGAKILLGGNRLPNNCFEATVLSDVTEDMLVMSREVFGPVMSLKPYTNIDEVIDIMNESEYSFQASIYTQDIDMAFNTAKKLETKAFMINDSTAFRVDWMPFGGTKASGLGVGGMKYSIQDMTEEKLIILNIKNNL